MLTKTLHLIVNLCMLLTMTACGPGIVKYTREIRVPDPVVEVKIDDPIATHIQILSPLLVTNKVPLYNKGNHLGYVVVDDEQVIKQFKKVLANSFQHANLYQSVKKMGTDLASHSLKTKVNIKEITWDGGLSWAHRTSDVEVEYILTSKEGTLLANGSVSVEGLNGEVYNGFITAQGNLSFYIVAMQDALSKAAGKILLSLTENSQFMHLARIDSNRNQFYANNSPPAYQPSRPSTSGAKSYNFDKPTLPNATNFGEYYALVIGNNQYSQMPMLRTARNDAEAIAALLEKNYSFKVTHIFDATRYDILAALDKLRSELTIQDNLLIYYAGHGYFDRDAERGYWLPVDANQDTSANWVSNADITDKLKSIRAKHVMIVADSCYSGTLTRGVNITARSSDYWQQVLSKRSRTVLTSGGMEPVTDGGGGGSHSVFANAFMSALKENQEIIDGTELFTKIRRPVMLNANQTPEYGDVRLAGHEGGDFLFVRKR